LHRQRSAENCGGSISLLNPFSRSGQRQGGTKKHAKKPPQAAVVLTGLGGDIAYSIVDRPTVRSPAIGQTGKYGVGNFPVPNQITSAGRKRQVKILRCSKCLGFW
jgi:hypothetical protein